MAAVKARITRRPHDALAYSYPPSSCQPLPYVHVREGNGHNARITNRPCHTLAFSLDPGERLPNSYRQPTSSARGLGQHLAIISTPLRTAGTAGPFPT
mmetsp:Transcript_39256/g.109196  ORF Transcript_39256/g.109196 Transcript_39256/m.109196 type:complete len:98 (-) Transcript_39256:305-598(-)